MRIRAASVALLLSLPSVARAEIDGDFHGVYLRQYTLETLPYDGANCGPTGTTVGTVRVLQSVFAATEPGGAGLPGRTALNVNHVEYWDWASLNGPPANTCLRITYTQRMPAAEAPYSPSTPCPTGHTCWLVHGPVTEQIAPPALDASRSRIFRGNSGSLYVALDLKPGQRASMEWLGLGEAAREQRVLFRPLDCDDVNLNGRPCSTVGVSNVLLTPYGQNVPISGLVSYRREASP